MVARALVGLIAILTGCQTVPPAAPTKVAGVLIEPAPDLEASCRDLVAPKRWLPCPTLLPNPRQVQVRRLADTRELFGVEFVFNVPDESYPRAQRPDGFLHLAILDADSGLGEPAEPTDLGGRTFGGEAGMLSLDETPEGFHKDHLVSIFEEGGHRVSVSLHAWDRLGEAERMLAAIVAGLR